MNFSRKNRPVQVRGVVLDNQDIINEGEADIVSVYYVPSDKSAFYVDKKNDKHPIEGQVVSYTSRFL